MTDTIDNPCKLVSVSRGYLLDEHMRLDERSIREFQQLYKKHFGKSIDFKSAEIEAQKLIKLVGLIQHANIQINALGVKNDF